MLLSFLSVHDNRPLIFTTIPSNRIIFPSCGISVKKEKRKESKSHFSPPPFTLLNVFRSFTRAETSWSYRSLVNPRLVDGSGSAFPSRDRSILDKEEFREMKITRGVSEIGRNLHFDRTFLADTHFASDGKKRGIIAQLEVNPSQRSITFPREKYSRVKLARSPHVFPHPWEGMRRVRNENRSRKVFSNLRGEKNFQR